MAGTLTVQTLQGPSSGANANKVLIPSGQTLYAAGHVVQVVSATSNTQTDSTSTSWSATNLSVSITPTSTSSKVLVTMSGGMSGWAGSNTTYDQKGGLKIYRSIGGGAFAQVETSSSGQQVQYGRGGEYDPLSITFLDSPSTTSQVTYTLYQRRESGSLTFSVIRDSNNQATATAMEIAQ
jgi:hypothetical protein